ncbi:F-box only protein 8-like [Rhopilema esculentum]|uniref:F-box only protein 8-like n=1 Tax=Rhopilema esculentum TaxID=499914 RepID=UPI0031E36B4B
MMGQVQSRGHRKHIDQLPNDFPDLRELPPEVAIAILAKLNATDLCLAACVWEDLAEDDILWKRLCYEKWGYVTAYRKLSIRSSIKVMTFKQLFLLLDEATLHFSYEPHQAIQYLIDNEVLDDNPVEIAQMFNNTKELYSNSMHTFLNERHDVLDELVHFQDYTNLFLSDAMRQFFKKIPPPKQRGEYFEMLMEKFSSWYFECNQNSGLSKDGISVLAYSLLLLSVDLYSPHVKNKMSKREFIRNSRQIVADFNREQLSDLYDDVYLNGHIAGMPMKMNMKLRQPFRPYGVLFELKSWNVQSCCQ